MLSADLLAYIRSLSERDSKTLSQKTLKGMEELGELARVVLAAENAQGALHRVAPRGRVLEEAVDTLLVAMSIAVSEGFSNEEIAEAVGRKADKWAARLACEGRVGAVIPFEIHVSVHPGSDFAAFSETCAGLGVKPLALDLRGESGGWRRDVMTSSVHRGSNASAMAELDRIAKGIVGFGILREKVETVPWHPMAPSSANPIMPPGCYFEAHIAAEVPEEGLEAFCRDRAAEGLAVSVNARKRGAGPGGSTTVMLTHREGVRDAAAFGTRTDALVAALETGLGLRTDVDREFVLHDTDPDWDARGAAAA